MSTSLLLIVTLIYFGVAGRQFYEGDLPFALVFAAYAIANAGLIWALYR